MGRQIHFYMLPQDRTVFLRVVQDAEPVTVTLRNSDSAKTFPIADPIVGDSETLCLWNSRLLPSLERKWVPHPGYYRADEWGKPILEFTSSVRTTWEGEPALLQGRLFGIFERKSPNFEKWYDSIVRWIRKNYRRGPAELGGYVGPAAYEFYKSGGYLLPNFLPPRTKEWVAEISKQHPFSEPPARRPKR